MCIAFCVFVLHFFFFFKQKTAYEMRISDWSSDVCSSDLQRGGVLRGLPSTVTLHLIGDYPATIRSPLRHCEERRHEALSSHRPCAARAGDCFAALAMTPTDARGILPDFNRVYSYTIRNNGPPRVHNINATPKPNSCK